MLLAAAHKDLIRNLTGAVRAAGLSVASVDLVPLALVRSVGRRVSDNGGGVEAVVSVGGGVPKNFTQDTVVCAEILGHTDVAMHKYAIQVTIADVRDGACSSSTLKEACSWGKVDTALEQMVFAEAGSVMPLMCSDAYHRGHWKTRAKRGFAKMFG